MKDIQYIPHSEIDFVRWDECINHAFNGNMYALSWYLNTVCEQWDALIIDDYQSVFPIPFKKRFGLLIIYQPFFVQQLGIFSLQPLSPQEHTQILQTIPKKFKVGRLQLNSTNDIEQKFKIQYHINHELNIAKNYTDLYAGFSENAKRNLKKAQKMQLECRESVSCDAMIEMFQKYKAPSLPKMPKTLFCCLQQLFDVLKNNHVATVFDAYTVENQHCASVLLLHNDKRLVYLFSGCTPEAYQNGAQFFLIDKIINKYAGQPLILDFEGSTDPNLARFYKGFGSKSITYPVLFFENMFLPAVKILQKMHKI